MAEKPEFTTVSFDSLNLRRAIEVSPSLYIEGNRSASEIGRAIGQLLDICNVDYNNVVIRYTSIDAESTPSSSEIASSRKTVENDVAADEKTVDVSELDNEIYEVIKAKYLNGFLVGAINFKKMRRFYEEIYAESKCSGAIVKRSSEINSMDDVVVEYLVMHKDIQTANDALNGLVEDGYIARKRYKNIEDLLVVAKAKGRA